MGATEAKAFGTRFASDSFSWVDFGNATVNNSDSTFSFPLRVNDDFFWSLSTSAVRFGENSRNAWAFNMTDPQVELVQDGPATGVYTIFDTGASDIMISKLWYEDFIIKLF